MKAKTVRRTNGNAITIGLDLGDKRHTYCVLDDLSMACRLLLIFP